MGGLYLIPQTNAQGMSISHQCENDKPTNFRYKTFQSYTQFKEIPRKLIVAKRLAQCLNPALPTGVHQRALEVYVHILSVLEVISSLMLCFSGINLIICSKADGLKRDLSLWSSGLFPFFEYAATSVKVWGGPPLS